MNRRIARSMADGFFYLTLYRRPKTRRWNIIRGIIFKWFGAFSPYLHLNRGDTVIYGGCFMIETVNEVTNAIGEQGRMYVVEADPDCADRLNYDIHQRRIKNAEVVNLGIWKERGAVTFDKSQVSHKNQIRKDSVYSTVPSASTLNQAITVEVDTIDNIVNHLGLKKLDAVFLTISGAEIEALSGMGNTLSTFKPHLIIRSAFIDKATCVPVYQVLKKDLECLGYTVFLGRENPDKAQRNIYAVNRS